MFIVFDFIIICTRIEMIYAIINACNTVAFVPDMTRALHRCLDSLSIRPPPDGKYASHYLRIGSHTKQVLLNIPILVRMASFGWGQSSEDMVNLYFDQTLRTKGASIWFFGAHYLPESTVSGLPHTVSIGSSANTSAPTS